MREEVDELTGMLKSNLEKVVQHGKRADSIVKNMLQHSREGSGERRSADINALVEESLNLAYHGARAEKPGFCDHAQARPRPRCGRARAVPAGDYPGAAQSRSPTASMPRPGARPRTATGLSSPCLARPPETSATTVEIRIRDNGTGIPPDVREKMFNPFFTTKPTGEGTGLGLSMTHDIIVKQHGGRIDVETEPGAFTEFIITLPRGNGDCRWLKSE